MPFDQLDFTPAAAPVVDDLWSLPRFIAWLEKQPKGGGYDFYNCNGGCLVGQYVRSRGLEYLPPHTYTESPENWQHQIACWGDRTFGAALSRAKTQLAQGGK